jgi:hypothetical protein
MTPRAQEQEVFDLKCAALALAAAAILVACGGGGQRTDRPEAGGTDLRSGRPDGDAAISDGPAAFADTPRLPADAPAGVEAGGVGADAAGTESQRSGVDASGAGGAGSGGVGGTGGSGSGGGAGGSGDSGGSGGTRIVPVDAGSQPDVATVEALDVAGELPADRSPGQDTPDDGSVGGPPVAEVNCGLSVATTVRRAVDVLLVLDRSQSMTYSIAEDCSCASAGSGSPCNDTTNCTTRWDAVNAALGTTLAGTGGINWGLKLFGPTTGTTCAISSTVEVPVSAGSADTIMQRVGAANFSLGTPTAATLVAATSYLSSLGDTNQKAILLATDGEPNCGGSPANLNTSDLAGAAAAASQALTAGFPVYVVGIGPNLSDLTQLAIAGGTRDYIPASSPQQLLDAFSAVANGAGSCEFVASTVPPDPGNLAVYVDQQLVSPSPSDGWSFGSSTASVVLGGRYCDRVLAGESVMVQILYGCPGGSSFPAFLP